MTTPVAGGPVGTGPLGAAPRRAPLATVPSALRWAAATLFVVSVPIFLITTNVWQTTTDLGVYERGFARYGVGQRTGLTTAQLQGVAQALIAYFDGPPAALDVQVDLAGSRRPLFNDREIAHMEDVQHLMHLVYRLELLSGAVVLLVPLAAFAIARASAVPTLARLCLAGAALTGAVLVTLGGVSLLDFSEVFLRFHMLSFSNDLWILDPARDYLIMLFPEGFWYDATMRIAAYTAIETVALALGGLALRFRGARA